MSRVLRFYIIISTIFVIFSVLVLGVGVLSFEKISNLASGLAEQKLRLNRISDKENSLSALQKKYESAEKDISKIDTALPNEKESSKLLSDLDSLAQESGLKLTFIQSDNFGKKQMSTDLNLLQTTKGKNSLELPLQLKLEGSFVSFSTFVKRLENYQRLVNISYIEIKKPTVTEDQSDKIEAEMKIVAYLKK